MLAQREQLLGEVQARLDPKLVGRHAEGGLELPDEMKRRDVQVACDVCYRWRRPSSRSRSRDWHKRRNP
jgi:hypothetical protein